MQILYEIIGALVLLALVFLGVQKIEENIQATKDRNKINGKVEK